MPLAPPPLRLRLRAYKHNWGCEGIAGRENDKNYENDLAILEMQMNAYSQEQFTAVK